MSVNISYQDQIDELKKLSYKFYLSLALGKEPLTYNFLVDGVETQVEVNATLKDESVSLIIDFDTAGKGRWTRSSAAQNLTVDKDNKWISKN